MIRRVMRVVTRSWPFARFVSGLERLALHHPNQLAVLTYHRVDEIGQRLHLSPALHSATPVDFDEQMRYLAERWHVLSARQVLDAVEHGTRLPPRSAMVTFDDAYLGFAEFAWPVLHRYRLPVTLFVPTGFPDRPERGFWWDRLYQAISSRGQPTLATPTGHFPIATPAERRRVFKQLRDYIKSLEHDAAMAWINETCKEIDVAAPEGDVLGWDALRELARQGVTLGAHSQTHPMMNRITPQRAREEAVASLADLRREVGPTLPIFAYPSGGFDDEVVDELDRAGFRMAFTTNRGLNNLAEAHPLRLRRINVGHLAPLALLQVQLFPRRPIWIQPGPAWVPMVAMWAKWMAHSYLGRTAV